MSSPTSTPERFGDVRWARWLAVTPGLAIAAAFLLGLSWVMGWAVTATTFAVRFMVESLWWDYRYGPPGNLLQRMFRL